MIVEGGLKAECNEMDVYSVLTKSLRHPKDFPSSSNSYFKKVQRIAKTCLKDSEFKKDFMEEKDKPEPYLNENACAILETEKLVSNCKKASP